MSFHWIKNKNSIQIKTELSTYAVLNGEKIEKIVICMHGYGDNAENAAQLADAFHLENVLYLFVQGPQHVPMSFSGYQWFDLFHDPHKKIEESAVLILQLYKHLTEDHGFLSDDIYFMGFSQGGAMALYCGLKTGQKIGGIVSMSGFMIHTAQIISKQKDLNKECPILLLHGDQDQTIFPILYFEAQGILKYLGFNNIIAKLYKMGHNVCAEEIIEIKKFLIRKDNSL